MFYQIKTLGCRTNLSESEALSLELTKRGHRYSATKPDLIVVNGCTVTAVADRKTRQTLTALKNKFPKARLVLIGCSARNATLTWPGVECFKSSEDLLETVPKRTPISELRSTNSEVRATSFELRATSSLKTRAHIKIQEGCNNHCTYCIISQVRGPERSVPLQQVLEELKQCHKRGVQEVVLTGTHIANWGQDFKAKQKLSQLVKTILKETEIQVLRLSSLEPQDFDQEFAELFKGKRVAPYLHLALQSGSDKILAAMGRKYEVSEVRKMVKALRKICPELYLGADLITGFPGETMSDFQATVKLCKELELSKLHVFPYSERPGTPAVTFTKQVPVIERRARARKLRELSHKLLTNYARKFVGQKLQVLVEQEYKGNRLATSTNFLKVQLPESTKLSAGSLLIVRITGWDPRKQALRALIDKKASRS